MQTALATPGYVALRKGRRSLPTQTYLVTTTTSSRTPLFSDFDRASLTAAVLADPVLWRESRLLCWVLMPDHWHGIIELASYESLNDLMRRVKAVTAAAVNRSEGRLGSVWAAGFHDHALRYEEDLVGIARYVVENPVRAGICTRVAEYPFWDAAWL
jgi:REP element-mobilizing transposase RayT